MKRRTTGVVLSALALVSAPASADTYINDPAGWEAAVGSRRIESLAFSSVGLVLADQIAAAPMSGDLLGGVLDFQATETGLPFGLTVTAQHGGELMYLEVPLGDFGDPVGGLGSEVDGTDHDFGVGLDGGSTTAVLVIMAATDPDGDEAVEFWGPSGMLGSASAPNVGGLQLWSVGFVSESDVPITQIRYADTAAPGGQLMLGLRFATTPIPEPSGAALAVLALAARARARRAPAPRSR